MWDTLHKIFVEIASAFSGIILWVIHGEEALERIAKWLGFVETIERHQGDRRHQMNFVSGLLLAESEAVKISAFIAKIPTYLPLIQQNIADLQKAASDKTNPAAEMGDVSALLNDLNSDLTLLLSIAPALQPMASTGSPVITPTPIATPPAAA